VRCWMLSFVQFHFGRVGSVRLFGCSVGSILFFWPTDAVIVMIRFCVVLFLCSCHNGKFGDR
jgi:hypothetical protein